MCVGGECKYVMKIWLNCKVMVVCGIISSDIENILCIENVELFVGEIEFIDCDFIVCIVCSYKD